MQDTIPSVNQARSRLGVAAHYRPDDLEDARRSLAEANIADAIRKNVAKAPPLTDDQRARLALLLQGGHRNDD